MIAFNRGKRVFLHCRPWLNSLIKKNLKISILEQCRLSVKFFALFYERTIRVNALKSTAIVTEFSCMPKAAFMIYRLATSCLACVCMCLPVGKIQIPHRLVYGYEACWV